MSTTKSSISFATRLGGLALLALFAARPALASAVAPADSTASPTVGTRVLPEPQVQPGPIASHLIYLGQSPRQAIANARIQGEEPRPLKPQAAEQARSSDEAYREDVLGLSPAHATPTRKARGTAAPAARS